jgi:hypothetical protein
MRLHKQDVSEPNRDSFDLYSKNSGRCSPRTTPDIKTTNAVYFNAHKNLLWKLSNVIIWGLMGPIWDTFRENINNR